MSQKYRVHRGITSRVIIVTIALILVAAISFTFAWFSGRFTNEGNIFQAAEPNAQIHLSLIAQSQVEDTGNPGSMIWPDSSEAQGGSADKLTFPSVEAMQAGLSNVALSNYNCPNGLTYEIDDGAHTDGGTNISYPVRFLNEKDWLPSSAITKRLIVQGNNINRAVDYNISFDIPGYNGTLSDVNGVTPVVNQEILAEALEVTVYEVTMSSGVETKTVVEGFNGIGAEELARKNLHGVLSGGGTNPNVTYEISIQLADSASYIYSKNLFNLDIKFESYSEVGKTHYVTNANELAKVLSNLADYDNIVLRAPEKDGKREIVIEEFITDKLFNLRLDDTDLKVTKTFEVQTGNKWGTIDLGMYGSAQLQEGGTLTNPQPAGMLVLPYSGTESTRTTAVVIDAPRVAMRYGKLAQLDVSGNVVEASAGMPKYLDNTALEKLIISVRALNGAQDIKSSALAVGSVVRFGSREWLIVDINDEGNITLLYHDPTPVKAMVFDSAEHNNDWSTADLRNILNDVMDYESAATNDQKFIKDFLGIDDVLKKNILQVTNQVEAYGNYGAGVNTDGRKASRDYVWLPSVSQIAGYDVTKPGHMKDPTQNDIGLYTLKELCLRTDGQALSDPAGGEQWQFFDGTTTRRVYDTIVAYASCTEENVQFVWLRTPTYGGFNCPWALDARVAGTTGITGQGYSNRKYGVVPALTLKSWSGVTVAS